MAVESPADIFLIGHNRLSIEAGLYARFLGYRVTMLGSGLSNSMSVGGEGQWELAQCTTPLGLKALESHEQIVKEGDIIDSVSLFDKYILPLAKSDLLSESIVDDCRSIQVSLGESDLPEKLDEDVEYDTRIFELAVEHGNGSQVSFSADVLIDFRDSAELKATEVVTSLDLTHAPVDQSDTNPGRLTTSIEDFYVLGFQRDPTNSDVNFQTGLTQILDLFRILSDRPNLDLYS